ncbi:MAG: division/cell wall cluster transcriptional repressor MraZ [Anaerolineaceae bacterium]|nr:division/cell wall cluster transcriptional repressor MraZ [Anaerolineaceae bacterium]
MGVSGTPETFRRSAILRKVERMFLGKYEHAIDEKGRTTIPARYRELLEEGGYITQGFDQNLILLAASTFNRIYQRVNQMSMTDPATRQLRRLIFSNADRIIFDRAGRILIPQFLRQAAGLDGQAIILGLGDYVEIWSPENWSIQNQQLHAADANAQRFAALDLSTQ